MFRAGDHVRPPSVLREKYVGPKNGAFGSFRSVGLASRSQVAYTKPLRNGSAVIDSLSLKNLEPFTSRISVLIGPQVLPPSRDELTVTAVGPRVGWSTTRAIWCASPLGESETHGSDARA